MYANLTVTTSTGKRLTAWKVDVDPALKITTVFLDDPDDESSYPVPRGAIQLNGACSIEPSF